MSQIVREHILHTFARVFESNSNTEFVVLAEGRESILTNNNPYIKHSPLLRGDGKGEMLSRREITIGGSV